MTETEWLACTDPRRMLEVLRGKASDRKLRLYATAWCRRGWAVLTNRVGRRAVEVSELFADGLATLAELKEARQLAGQQVRSSGPRALPRSRKAVAYLGLRAAVRVAAADAWDALEAARAWWGTGRSRAECEELDAREPRERADLLRDIFGPLPFRPRLALGSSLLAGHGGLVVDLAQAAYDDRLLPAGELSTVRLAVLADALEEGGCTHSDLLGHLRAPGPHARGCWAVDLVLDRP